MQLGPDDRLAIIWRYYQAYERDDRSAIEPLLHPELTFTSPQDARIDRAAYFDRCWPGHQSIKSFTLLDLCADAQMPWSDTGRPSSTDQDSAMLSTSNSWTAR
jgi:hypothetical protein